MSIVSTTIMAFSMSADAFAVSIGKGACLRREPRLREALQMGMLFGMVEAITPVLGWLAGTAASEFITAVDHWVCFFILGLVGAKMIFESFKRPELTPVGARPGTRIRKFSLLLVTAIGTSVDAMAVGVSLAFMNVNIWLSAAAIGLATSLMVMIGMMTGHYVGARAGKIAEALGGVGLILIGLRILLTHLALI